MSVIMFYGILILMYFYDNKKHSRPHIHAEYGEDTWIRIRGYFSLRWIRSRTCQNFLPPAGSFLLPPAIFPPVQGLAHRRLLINR